MPAHSKKQKQFFQMVRAVQTGNVSPSKVGPAVRKVAKSISVKDAGDFAKSVAELKVKKAILSILKDSREPMYLEEGETNVIVKEFNVEGKFEEYVKRFLGQRLSEKELEAVNTFQKVKPTKIESTQIRYETTDAFKNSNTTIIKKLKEGIDFVFVAFTKFSKAEKPEDQQQMDQNAGGMGGMSNPTGVGGMGSSGGLMEVKKSEPQIYLNWPEPKKLWLMEVGPMDPLGATPAAGAMPPALSSPPPFPSVGPATAMAPMTGTQKSTDQRKKEMNIDDIVIKKSTTFNDDIKGGAILAEFLKKLDL